MAEHSKEPKYFFFVGNDKYETDMEVVTGAYVKSRVPNFPAGAGLSLEGHGNDPDRTINDDDKVSLDIGHGEGPKRFTIVPPANFG